MIGIAIDMPVMNNTFKLESVLQKKNNSLFYPKVYESLATEVSLTAYIDGNEIFLNLLTKVLCGGKRRYVVNNILHDIYDGDFRLSNVAK